MYTELWIAEQETAEATQDETCYVCAYTFSEDAPVYESIYGEIVCSEDCKESYEEGQHNS